ncbi:component of IIS longevity pathway SMK-1-domain-containing protein [Coniochaeta sp. 2T2.1]|nr:component of IIS longevity pathway SMK-1-domain-containing protein [Coniochaeta sp. 2T2.1]
MSATSCRETNVMFRNYAAAQPSEKVAALTILSQADTELSLQQHLDLAPDLLSYDRGVPGVEPEPLMMAQPVPHQSTDRRRVKVYELRNNDWFDRGTGFCTAAYVPVEGGGPKEPRVIVESEDQPDRLLLETRICKEDGFQKQQDTLIVWTEPSNGVDMALSFQEGDGCAMIWKFVNTVQQQFAIGGPDDSLSEDLAMDIPQSVHLPLAELGNLQELEASMRMMTNTGAGRDALAKSIMNDDYISKLIPLVEMAEDLESLPDLHRLCNIMKTILLLNDTGIIEHALSDECVLGVVGALEYDPDFPSHKANHRQWLNNQGRYKEVVRIEDEAVRRKIHQTYRLQYLKDVVLARILDDPTFSVLNSLIFFNQVDIVQHLLKNASFLNDLFSIFADPKESQLRKKEAVLFIQQCCSIAKNLQPPGRGTLYNNFLQHGLLSVVTFGLRNFDVTVRVGATDILVCMIDHDPQMIRHTIYRQLHEKHPPLTDTLIDLLLIEVDLGIRSQISDSLKVLLDSNPPQQQHANGENTPAEFIQRRPQPPPDDQQEHFLVNFYENSAVRLFRPLLDLEKRKELKFNANEDGVFGYLNDILCFYIGKHGHRSKFFVLNYNIAQRFIQLLNCKEKHLQLVAIRFFRHLIMMNDEFYMKNIAQNNVLGPILDVLIRTLPRDNLLCSACLDFFDLIKSQHIKMLIKHLAENHRERVASLSYMNTFAEILNIYEQSQGYDNYLVESEDEVAQGARRPNNIGARSHMEQLTVDPAEEEYWNTSDNEDEPVLSQQAVPLAEHHEGDAQQPGPVAPSRTNGGLATKPLVDYASDEEGDENGDVVMSPTSMETEKSNENQDPSTPRGSTLTAATPPLERVSEKRRREQDEDDELDKLILHKRRNSSASNSSATSGTFGGTTKKANTKIKMGGGSG